MTTPLTLEAILARATPRFKNRCGVYFLISGTEIVYVGHSVNIEGRMAEHCRTKDYFDSWACVECEATDLESLEAFYQQRFQPRMNGGGAKRPRAISTPHGMFPSMLAASKSIPMPMFRIMQFIKSNTPGWTLMVPVGFEKSESTLQPVRRKSRPIAPLGVPEDSYIPLP